jgi:hypothetical protein
LSACPSAWDGEASSSAYGAAASAGGASSVRVFLRKNRTV